MAELLLGSGFSDPRSLGARVSVELPDEYIVVDSPVVHNRSLDAVVVAPQGLFVLYGRDWTGTIMPVPRLPWRQQLPDGQTAHQPNPASETRQASKALAAFLKDELPSLRPEIRHLLVLTDSGASVSAGPATVPTAVSVRDVGALIVSRVSSPKKSLPDAEIRKALATAIHRRQLTSRQRTTEPFVFRSGGAFSSGAKVSTVRDAVERMDKHPDDGIFHLHNGTLGRWFTEQGAPDLANMAQRVTNEYASDPKAGLEVFLARTGLVKRSRPRVRPKKVNLGYALAGETCSTRLRVRKGKGRGYLFGTLETDDPWLRVEPNILKGEPVDTKVTAVTTGLPIGSRPVESAIRIESDVFAEPMRIPVRLRVRAVPSWASMYISRPLIGLITGLLLGAVCGWALGRWGIAAPAWLPGPSVGGMSSAFTLAMWVGGVWAVLGALRGFWQPVAWPPSVALVRWLARLLLWAVALSIVVVAGQWSWSYLSRVFGLGSSGPTMRGAVLIACSLSALPAVIGEIQLGRYTRQEAGEPIGRLKLRPVGRAGLIFVGLIVLAIVGGAAVPLWERYEMPRRVSAAKEWAVDRMGWLEEKMDSFFDEAALDAYDRRAPPRPTAEGPTPSPTAKVRSTEEAAPEGDG